MAKNYDYALLSVEVYRDEDDTLLLPPGRLPTGWSILLDAAPELQGNGYFGSAYFNSETKQLIIAHRGTSPGFEVVKDIGDDVWLALLSSATEQFWASAVPFIDAVAIEYIRITGLNPYEHVSHTGHSLGGFLAELCGARDRSPVVSFDSPGSRPNIQELVIGGSFTAGALEWAEGHVTTFNAASNAINTANRQVGKVYRAYPSYTTIDGTTAQPASVYYAWYFSFTGQHRMGPIFQQFQPGQDFPAVYSEPYAWPQGVLGGRGHYENYDENPYYWEEYMKARWAANPLTGDLVPPRLQTLYDGDFSAYRAAFIANLNHLPNPELQTGVTILTHGLSNAEIFGTTNKRDRVITTEGNYDIPDFGGSDRYENVRAVNKYKFLPDSVTADEDVIADENAPANQIFMGDRLFGTDAPTCVSEVSCTMVHDGRTFNLGMQGSDLVIQAQSSSHSVRVEEFENGDFGIDLSKRRVEIPDLRVDAIVSLGNGNIALLGRRLSDLVPSPENMITPHVSYQIRNMNGGLVQGSTRLLTADTTSFSALSTSEEYEALKSIKLSNGNSFIGFVHRTDGNILKGMIVNAQMQVVVAPFRVGTVVAAEGGHLQEVVPLYSTTFVKEFGCAALEGEEEGFAVSWADVLPELGSNTVRVFIRYFANTGEPKAEPVLLHTTTFANFPFRTGAVAQPDGVVDVHWSNVVTATGVSGAASILPGGEVQYLGPEDVLKVSPTFPFDVIDAGYTHTFGRMMFSDKKLVEWGVGSASTSDYKAAATSLLIRGCAYGSRNLEMCNLPSYTQSSAFPVNLSWYSHNLQMRAAIVHQTLQKHAFIMATQMDIRNTEVVSSVVTYLEIISSTKYHQPVDVRTELEVPVMADRAFSTILECGWAKNATFISGPYPDKLRMFYASNNPEGTPDVVYNFNDFSAGDKIEVVLSYFAEGYPPGVYLSQPTAERPYAQISLVDFTYHHYVENIGRTLEQFNALPRTRINIAFAPGQKRDAQMLSLADIEFSTVLYNPYRVESIPAASVSVLEGTLPLLTPLPPPPVGEPTPEPGFVPEPGFSPMPGSEPMGQPGQVPVPPTTPPVTTTTTPSAQPPSGEVTPPPMTSSASPSISEPFYMSWIDTVVVSYALALGKTSFSTVKLKVQNLLAPANTNAEPKPVVETPGSSGVVSSKATVTVRNLNADESIDVIAPIATAFATQAHARGYEVNADDVQEVLLRHGGYTQKGDMVDFTPQTAADLQSLLIKSNAQAFGSSAAMGLAEQFIRGFAREHFGPSWKTALGVEAIDLVAKTALYGPWAAVCKVSQLGSEVVSAYDPRIGGMVKTVVDTAFEQLMLNTASLPVLAAQATVSLIGPYVQEVGAFASRYLQGHAQQQEEKQLASSR